MSATASTLVAVNATPTAPTDVWAPLTLPRADWSSPIAVDTTWATIVEQATSGAEIRAAQQTRPALATVYLLTALTAAELGTLRAWQRRRLQARTLIPLWSDRTRLTATAAGSATTLSCDTRWRRFSIGARVGLVPVGQGAAPTTCQVATITAIAEDDIAIAAPGLDAAAPAGTLVVPLIEADAQLTTTAGLITTAVGRVNLEAIEDPGPWCGDPITTPAGWDAGEQLVDGMPVLDLADAWASGLAVDRTRPGAQQPVGLGTITRLTGAPVQHLRGAVRCLTRAAAWAWLTRFHAARGRLQPMVALDPQARHTATALTTTSVTVAATGSVHAWSERPLLYLVKADGTAALRTITSATRNGAGTEDTLTWSATDPLTAWALEDLATVATAYRVRFASDSLTETWTTDTTCTLDIDLVEIHSETTVAIADLTAASISADGEKAYPLDGWCFGIDRSQWSADTCTTYELWAATGVDVAAIWNDTKAISTPGADATTATVWYAEVKCVQYSNMPNPSIPGVGLLRSSNMVTDLDEVNDSIWYYYRGFEDEPEVDHDVVWASLDRVVGMLLDLANARIRWFTTDDPDGYCKETTDIAQTGYYSVRIGNLANVNDTHRWELNTGQRDWAYPSVAALARGGLSAIEALP